ncbi:MAG: methyltransferase domain-containing protein [Flavobacterium sp.]
MEASFDKAAACYDRTFSDTMIGRMQRSLVRDALSKHLKNVRNILEVNCGTGEDAIWLARKTFKITASDVSPKMIEVAKNKAVHKNLDYVVSDIKYIDTTFDGRQFDLIFSNFGGLNCLTQSELEKFFRDSKSLLPEKGKMVLVIMPQNTLWEQLYFLAKAQFSNVFRRKKEMVLANVDGEKVPTYYFNPKDIVNLAKHDFELVDYKPIGFFVPPSYMEPFFRDKMGILRFLNHLESSISKWRFLSKYADHYIITLQKQ